ncbi:MAG: hypothetical protein KDD36_10725 [Flavobacteriales bacterium]|nr:hypothetical protein [Flavobacteriales bacterium]
MKLEGNKVTKAQILLRELAFSEGDTILTTEWEVIKNTSRNNLLNTSLFNYVTIDTSMLTNINMRVIIKVEERWYTWPMPIFELADRNFNVWWKSKDLSRTHYGFYLVRDNFRGRKESLSIRLRLGYSQQFSISYAIPYLNRKQKSGLRFAYSYTRSREVNVTSMNNEQVFFKDDTGYPRKHTSTDIVYSLRKGFYNQHAWMLRFNTYDISDTLAALNEHYLGEGNKHLSFFTATYLFKHDRRNFKPYPLAGYYIDFEIVKHGLGFFTNHTTDVLYATGTVKWFKTLAPRWYTGASFGAKLSSAKRQPYALQRGLGYGNAYVRSYELKVVDGQNFWLARANIKFALVRPMIKKFAFIPAEKFNKISFASYLNVFMDAGYLMDKPDYYPNPLQNTILTGLGLGLDLVTYYDKVMRLEYAVSRFGEAGFFVHFTAPI